MSESTEIMHQVNALVNVPELHTTMSDLRREMMTSGLVSEMVDEGLEEMDGPDLEEAAEAEVAEVLDELAIDAELRMQMGMPAPAAPSPEVAAAAEADAQREAAQAEA